MIIRIFAVCRYFSLVALIYVFSGCYRFYNPGYQHVTLFQEEKEMQFGLGTDWSHGIGLDYLDLYVAANPIKHVGLSFDFLTYYGNVKGKNSENSYRHYNFSAGLGGYLPVWEKFVFENYLICSYGFYHKPSNFNLLNNFDFAFQPAFGYRHKYFSIALSGSLKERFFRSDNKDENNYMGFKDVIDKNFYFIEPAITVGYGTELLKLEVQYKKIFVEKSFPGSFLHYYIGVGVNLYLKKSTSNKKQKDFD
jgi:hypothetical protein